MSGSQEVLRTTDSCVATYEDGEQPGTSGMSRHAVRAVNADRAALEIAGPSGVSHPQSAHVVGLSSGQQTAIATQPTGRVCHTGLPMVTSKSGTSTCTNSVANTVCMLPVPPGVVMTSSLSHDVAMPCHTTRAGDGGLVTLYGEVMGQSHATSIPTSGSALSHARAAVIPVHTVPSQSIAICTSGISATQGNRSTSCIQTVAMSTSTTCNTVPSRPTHSNTQGVCTVRPIGSVRPGSRGTSPRLAQAGAEMDEDILDGQRRQLSILSRLYTTQQLCVDYQRSMYLQTVRAFRAASNRHAAQARDTREHRVLVHTQTHSLVEALRGVRDTLQGSLPTYIQPLVAMRQNETIVTDILNQLSTNQTSLINLVRQAHPGGDPDWQLGTFPPNYRHPHVPGNQSQGDAGAVAYAPRYMEPQLPQPNNSFPMYHQANMYHGQAYAGRGEGLPYLPGGMQVPPALPTRRARRRRAGPPQPTHSPTSSHGSPQPLFP